MEIITISSRGQLVIPQDVRRRHKIGKGTKLVLFDHGDRIILEKEDKIKSLLKHGLDAEERGWDRLAEQSLNEVWDNRRDDKTWKKYLQK